MKKSTHILLLTGMPGVGKTTVIRRVAERLLDRKISGFFTQEIRAEGKRKGFQLVCFDGKERTFADVGYPSRYRVSKYGVDVAVLDGIAAEVLSPNQDVDFYLVDEIGKMECFSEKFIQAMQFLLASEKTVVATVALRGDGFIEQVKQLPNTVLWQLTRENRDHMPDKVLAWLHE